MINDLIMNAGSDHVYRRSAELAEDVEKFGIGGFFEEMGHFGCQAVGHGVVGDDGSSSDHDELMCILLVCFCGGNVEAVLKLCDEAFYDHPLFFQAVDPGGVESEGQGEDLHG